MNENKKTIDVTALGELLVDFTMNGQSEQGNQIFEACPGGAPCNVLALLQKMGKKTAFIGKVGNDQFGKMLKATIEEAGIDTSSLVFDNKVNTTLAFVHTFENGDRDFSFYRNPGADMMLTATEVNEKTMALCIKGGKISAQLLKAALTKLLAEIEKKKQQSKKMGGQNRCKRGKQSIKSLQQSGAQLTNIVVTDNNIKSFDRVARKYGVDYSLKKAEKEGKTEYLVFFKAKDVDVMTAAFKEYTGVSLKKEQRQSIRKKLEQAKERVAKHREITKEKTKDRGQVR
mgnify:CR=1 FL=1